jgi:high-affinity Fe2+/Pb2+ permease
MKNIFEINKAILRQINLWTWMASVLPLSALAGLWFAWVFGSKSLLNIVMVVGGTTMFITAVLWWWWALRVMRQLLSNWERAETGIQCISGDIKEIRSLVKEVIEVERDK